MEVASNKPIWFKDFFWTRARNSIKQITFKLIIGKTIFFTRTNIVEITPNLAGLAEPKEGVHPGQFASVYIKSLLPEKMKVKLIIVDAFDALHEPEPVRYFRLGGHIDRWIYSPPTANRIISSEF